ncbi:MAG: ECF transporter S component [Clostridium butyricum]|nr:ECF transporter S component [Clostridium butyricum]
MEKSNLRTNFSTKEITMIGMLSGISIFLGVTRLGFIPLGPINATIMHIPVIIGAIVGGPVVGALVGLVFGLFSMYQAFTVPLPTSFIFWNPLIAIVPRVLIGIVAYYLYNFLKNKFKNEKFSIGISSILATLTNTIGVMGLTYIIYLDKYATALGVSKKAATVGILTIIGINGSIEAIISAIISVALILTIFKIRK